MLEVLLTKPQQAGTGIYLDASIEIVFSHELHDSSLSSDKIRLYLMPGWSGQVPCTLSKSGATLIITPSSQLTADTQYSVWIKGGDDGVLSLTGQSISANYILDFTTGNVSKETEELSKNVDLGGFDSTDGNGNVLLTPDEHEELLYQNSVLDVVYTSPSEDSIHVEHNLESVTFTFDQGIVLNDSYIGTDITKVAKITAQPYLFGLDVVIPTIETVTDGSTDLVIGLSSGLPSGELSLNTKYSVTIPRKALRGYNDQYLVEDFILEFSTDFEPLYSNVHEVRFKGQSLIPSALPDAVIEEYIFRNSIWVLRDILNYSEVPDGNPNSTIVTLVTCKTVFDIAEGITLNELYGIKTKELADLRIEYDRAGIRDKIAPIESCINNSLNLLGRPNTSIGVKSRLASARAYPGGKRTITNYPRR